MSIVYCPSTLCAYNIYNIIYMQFVLLHLKRITVSLSPSFTIIICAYLSLSCLNVFFYIFSYKPFDHVIRAIVYIPLSFIYFFIIDCFCKCVGVKKKLKYLCTRTKSFELLRYTSWIFFDNFSKSPNGLLSEFVKFFDFFASSYFLFTYDYFFTIWFDFIALKIYQFF